VPAILISPFVQKGSVDSTVYEHSSIPATVKKLFGLSSDFLTERDRTANTFEGALSLAAPRTDAPARLPRVFSPDETESFRELARRRPSEDVVRSAMDEGRESRAPLTEFQESLVQMATELERRPQMRTLAAARPVRTEHDAAVYAQEQVERWLAEGT
jgi:phospholipase C